MVKFSIAGKANSGKNTAANLLGQQFLDRFESGAKSMDKLILKLKSQYPKEFKVFGFADPMKEMIMRMYPDTDPDILWGASELRMTPVPNTFITFRQLLMDLGKLGRGYNPNVWIEATVSAVNKYAETGNVPIISDVRFSNEFQILKKEGFFLIRIIRPNNPYQKLSASQDISEIDLDGVPDSEFDTVLTNDGSIEDLKSQIAKLLVDHF